MKCLVTGAAGGIGSHLCEMLIERGHIVRGVDNYSVGRFTAPYIRKFDCAGDEAPTIDHGYDWVFHLAGLADIVPSIEHPLRYHNANVTGTVRMLEWARHAGVRRFIYAASSSCYGIPAWTPTPETTPCAPQYPYALTKHLGEQYVLHYARVYGLPSVSLRLFNVYGPRFRTAGTYGAVFGVFLAQLANRKPLTIVGDGTQRRDFTHVSDVCRAFIAAAESTHTEETFNVGSGNSYSINMLAHLLGSVDRVYLPKRPGEPDCTYADIRKIQAMLRWQPAVPFDEGVRSMLLRLDEYKKAPLWTPDSIARATAEWHRRLST